jgi:hypothetical protein
VVTSEVFFTSASSGEAELAEVDATSASFREGELADLKKTAVSLDAANAPMRR